MASSAHKLSSLTTPRPRRPAIRSTWPVYAEDEIAAAVEVLRSGRVNALQHGDRCRAFEAAFAELCSMPHAISLANGTLALELALRSLSIGPGDEVVVTARSFVASASCIVNVGATPVFTDVDPESQNVMAASIAHVLTEHTKAVIVVHLAGWPCEMAEIMELAGQRGLKVIEDCAQSHGARYRGQPAGSFGDAAAFSFCCDKIISTGGEGGMLLLRDRDAWQRAWSYKDHGKDREALTSGAKPGLFQFVHSTVGSNFRMTEMQAAIGLRQLGKLPGWSAARHRNAAILQELLSRETSLHVPSPPPHVVHAHYKFYAFVRNERLRTGWDRNRIVLEAQDRGAPVFTGTCPEIYREGAFRERSIGMARLPVARRLGETSLMMPIDQTLDEDAVEAAGNILKSVLHEAQI